MKIKSTFYYLVPALILGSMLTMSLTFNRTSDTGPWVAPKSADTIVNRFGNADALSEGKKLYGQLCSVCHGDKGKGDGIAAAGLTPKPADHTSEKIQAQSDGAIFWKLTTGRPPMAGYAASLTAKQRWALVGYIRTLKKAAKK